MKIDVLGLQAFTAIVDRGSFGEAAQMLHISQTALSHRLKALEAQLDSALIDRTTRSWELTPIGERFYPRAKRLVEELQESFRELSDTARERYGHITIASISMTAVELVPQAIQIYSRLFPNIRTRILELPSPGVVEAVVQGRADIGICVYAKPHRETEIDIVADLPYVLVCRDDHPLSHRRRVRWSDIHGQSVISLVNTGSAVLLDRIFTGLDFEVKVVHEAQRSATALALVAAGLGVAIIPKLAVNSRMYPKLRSITLNGPVIERKLVMIRRKNIAMKSHIETLYKAVSDVLSR